MRLEPSKQEDRGEAVRGAEPYSTDRSTVLLLLKGNGKTLRGLRRAAGHFSKIFWLRYRMEGQEWKQGDEQRCYPAGLNQGGGDRGREKSISLASHFPAVRSLSFCVPSQS